MTHKSAPKLQSAKALRQNRSCKTICNSQPVLEPLHHPRSCCCPMPPATTMRAVLLQLGAVGPSRLLRSQRAALAGGRYGWLALQPARLERAAAAERRWARPLRTATAANSAAPAPAADAASSGKQPPHKQLQPARERKHYSCPACGQHCYRAEVLQRHLFKCCPDIVRLEVSCSLHSRTSL